jgi:hypothetical protein
VPPWWVMAPGDLFVILYVVKPDFELFNSLFFPAVPPQWVMEPGDSFVILFVVKPDFIFPPQCRLGG